MNITADQLTKRVEAWQKRLTPLALAHFRVEVTMLEDIPGKMESSAGCYVADNYDDVTFYFHPDFVAAASPQALDETIVHEWVHVAMRDFENAINLARPYFSEHAWSTFDSNLDHQRESIVDRLARALFELYDT